MDIHGVSQVNDWLTDGQTDWLNESINQLINRSIDQLINQLINEILTIAETVAQSRCVSGHTVATQWCSDRWAVGARDTVGRTLCRQNNTRRLWYYFTYHIVIYSKSGKQTIDKRHMSGFRLAFFTVYCMLAVAEFPRFLHGLPDSVHDQSGWHRRLWLEFTRTRNAQWFFDLDVL